MQANQQKFSGTKRFVIQHRLGAGGFGEVYQVYDKERDTVVALKTLRNTEPEALYRFKQEFRTIADIVHPNLVTLYELLSDGEQWFFTMELVKGVEFIDYVNLGKTENQLVNFSRLKKALTQLSSGIYTLHSKGKLHCDLKPSNVLVTEAGRVTILDFGLITELSKRPFGTTLSYGTPEYLAPEIALGEAASEASDWYSLGVMCYEALTGALPFDNTFGDVLTEKQLYDPPPPSSLVDNIPKDLDVLCQALLRRDPNKRPKGESILATLGTNHSKALSVATSNPTQNFLVGREEHLAKLKNSFELLKEGNTVINYVEGLSGMGKSILIRHFLDAVVITEPNTLVLTGRCYEQEFVPYKAFDSVIDNLTQHLKTLLPEDLITLIPNNALALAKLFPVLHQIEGIAVRKSKANIPDSQELRRRAFAALRQLFQELANRYLVVIYIDDLQWGDLDSISLLNELLSPPNAPKILLIFSYRSDEIESSPFLKTLFSSPVINSLNVEKIIVGELSDNDARRLVFGLFDKQKVSDRRVEMIVREANGNPFFINELVYYSQQTYQEKLDNLVSQNIETTPVIETNLSSQTDELQDSLEDLSIVTTRLEDVIYYRISQLPIAAQRLMEIIAVAGQPIARLIAKRTADLDREEPAAVALLRTNHLIRVRGSKELDKIEVYHDRIRETIINKLTKSKLKDYHSKLASVLELIENIDPEVLLVHFQGAGDTQKAIKYASLAADQAMEGLAFDHAAKLYKLIIELQPTESKIGELEEKLALALTNAGRTIEAAQAYLLAAGEVKERLKVLKLKQSAAEQLLRGGHVEEGLSVLGDVLAQTGMYLPQKTWQSLVWLLFGQLQLWWRGVKFKERNISEIAPEEIVKIDICWSAATGLTMVDAIRGTDFQVRHLNYALKVGEPYRLARAFAWEITFASTNPRETKRLQTFSKLAENLVNKIDNPHAQGLYLLMSGMAHFFLGKWAEAYELTKKAGKILRERCTAVNWEIYTAEVFLFRTLFQLGELAEILERVNLIVKEAQSCGDLYAETSLRTRASYLYYLILDKPEQASNELKEAIEKWSQTGFHAQHYYSFVAYCEIALYCGDGEKAWELIKENWAKLKRSLMMRVQFILIEACYLFTRVTIASALKTDKKEYFLSKALKFIKRLEKEKIGYSQAYSLLGRAALTSFTADNNSVITYLSEAENKFLESKMLLHVATTQYVRGKLIGGLEGTELLSKAEKAMKEQKIENINAFVQMMLPGKWEK